MAPMEFEADDEAEADGEAAGTPVEIRKPAGHGEIVLGAALCGFVLVVSSSLAEHLRNRPRRVRNVYCSVAAVQATDCSIRYWDSS